MDNDETARRSQAPQAPLAEMSTPDAPAKDEPGDCCVICLDSITDKAAAIPCGHSAFDFLCLASWLQQRSSCPLCTASVSSIHYSALGKHQSYPVTSTKPLPPPPLTTPSTPRPPLPPRRRRPPQSHTPRPTPAPDAALARRRAVYAHARYAQHVGSNPLSRFRDFTPHSFRASAPLQARARTWIRRELRVFAFLSPDAPPTATSTTTTAAAAGRATRRADNAEFLLEYTVSILKTLDVQGAAGQAAELLREFLGAAHAGLFLHELRHWLRSPFARLEDWDRNVQYAGEGARGCGDAGGVREARRRGTGEGGRESGRRGDTVFGDAGQRRVREARRRYAPD